MTRFEVFKGANDDWYWRLKAGNGEIIAVSEGYESRQMAIHGIDSVKENAPVAQILIEDDND